MPALTPIGDHPEDLYAFALESLRAKKNIVIVIIVAIEGSSSRRVGTPMIVLETGDYAGYVSSGCLDEDIAGQALEALKTGRTHKVRYGKGSKYIDLILPCGGGLDLLCIPNPEIELVAQLVDAAKNRCPGELSIAHAASHYKFEYAPRLRIVVFGEGGEASRLVEIAKAGNIEVILNPETDTIKADEWTAIILMFHDHEKELPILKSAIETPAFYIGAMGSRKSHSNRMEALAEMGLDSKSLSRIKGPIGLVPSTRDASRLAISVLAEIYDFDRKR